jgi:hypothetical protein
VDVYDLGRGDFRPVVFDKAGEHIAAEAMRGEDLALP